MADTCDNELTRFWERLAKGFCGGIPLSQILASIEQSLDDGPLLQAVQDLSRRVTQGDSLSKAMSMNPNVFSRAHIALVEGGERLGMVDRVLPLIVEATWRCPTCGNLQMPGPAAKADA